MISDQFVTFIWKWWAIRFGYECLGFNFGILFLTQLLFNVISWKSYYLLTYVGKLTLVDNSPIYQAPPLYTRFSLFLRFLRNVIVIRWFFVWYYAFTIFQYLHQLKHVLTYILGMIIITHQAPASKQVSNKSCQTSDYHVPDRFTLVVTLTRPLTDLLSFTKHSVWHAITQQ